MVFKKKKQNLRVEVALGKRPIYKGKQNQKELPFSIV
jgi:hypothetical protein